MYASPALPPPPQSTPDVALLLTDLVDSAALAAQHGDEAMAPVWAAHDRLARDLLRQWRGREIDKTDGFLLLFADPADALDYVLAYHRSLAALPLPQRGAGAPPLRARAGLHVGQVTMRETPAADVALGAKPVEVDGVSKPIAARVMSAALGGQTLLTVAAMVACGASRYRSVSHGHWHVKGLAEPLELFEVGDESAPFAPPPDSDKVYRVVLQGELWLPRRELRHSLPAERDAFVGRRGTLHELARCFDGRARLVSMLGIGGGGKTRLATHFGWGWMGEFPGGVWFCDLAPARTLEGLVSAVAQGLQLPLGQEDPVVQIGNAIAGRGPCLVILDNFEQLTRHAEATLGRWLDRAARACFLVTTREVLGIAGEQTLTLAPMRDADASALFHRRAAAAKRDFKPSPADEAAIAKLVGLLDGLPLAIELAAARVRTLAPHALLARMSERFKLLASSGGRQDRQATLRAAFDWSWDLLHSAEKAALAQLSVFEGGFTLEAAEAVIDLQHLADPPWTLDVVHSLVDKSFVRTLGNERFSLLVSVQAYAAEHLATEGRFTGSGPAAQAAAWARHGAWFAALGPQRATENACADLDNLAEACRRAVLAGDAERAAGALDGAWAALNLHGPFKAGVDLARPVCAMAGLQASAAAHAHAVLGWALEACGQRGPAADHFAAALEHARSAADLRCEAAVTIRLGALHARDGLANQAREEHTRALAQGRQLQDAGLECAALNGLGTVDFEQGRMDDAQQHYETALRVARAADDRHWQGLLLGNLCNLHANLGHISQARTQCEEALAGARLLGDRQREGRGLNTLAMLDCLQGRVDEAVSAADGALLIARELGYVRLEFAALGTLGLALCGAGRLDEAQERNAAALAIARQLGLRRAEGQILGQQGLVHALQGGFAQARQNLQSGLQILRDAADGLSLGVLLCSLAECEWLAGEPNAANAALDEAVQLAAQAGAGPESEVGVALARAGRRLQRSPDRLHYSP